MPIMKVEGPHYLVFLGGEASNSNHSLTIGASNSGTVVMAQPDRSGSV